MNPEIGLIYSLLLLNWTASYEAPTKILSADNLIWSLLETQSPKNVPEWYHKFNSCLFVERQAYPLNSA